MGLIKTTSFDHHKGNKPITTILTPPGWVASESDSLTDLMARDNGVSKIAWLPENFQFSGEDSGGGDKDEGDSYSDSESDSGDSQEPAEKLTSRGFVVGRRNGVVEFYGPDHMLREDVELCDDDDESSSSDNDSNSDSDSDSDSIPLSIQSTIVSFIYQFIHASVHTFAQSYVRPTFYPLNGNRDSPFWISSTHTHT